MFWMPLIMHSSQGVAMHAGRVIGPNQVMHNGLLICRDSYHGSPVRLMLGRNRGVHEPQEERVFGESREAQWWNSGDIGASIRCGFSRKCRIAEAF